MRACRSTDGVAPLFCTAPALSRRNSRWSRPHFQQFFGATPRRNRPHWRRPCLNVAGSGTWSWSDPKASLCVCLTRRHLVSKFKNRVALLGDRGFESCSLQRRVSANRASAPIIAPVPAPPSRAGPPPKTHYRCTQKVRCGQALWEPDQSGDCRH
jgi:hypothetical protein